MGKINQQILGAIEIYINDLKENGPFDRTEPATIIKVNSSTSYDIIMNGILYSKVPFLLNNETLAVSNSVWVRIPKNNLRDMYIDRRRK